MPLSSYFKSSVGRLTTGGSMTPTSFIFIFDVPYTFYKTNKTTKNGGHEVWSKEKQGKK